MFTGIVSEVGIVTAIEPTETGRRITVAGPVTIADMTIGDSVAVNGVCLTAIAFGDGSVTVEAVDETLRRTNLGRIEQDHAVNLERPVPGHGRLDGHIVQGHVDGTGTVEHLSPEGDATRIRITIPDVLAAYVVEKGSIAVDGVSLTVTGCSARTTSPAWFEVVLIPHTLEVTVLGGRQAGELVNLEMDIIAKYVERMMEGHRMTGATS